MVPSDIQSRLKSLNLNTERLPRVFVATYDEHPIGERREVFSPATRPLRRGAGVCNAGGGRVVITSFAADRADVILLYMVGYDIA
jgi:hypothetical protein